MGLGLERVRVTVKIQKSEMRPRPPKYNFAALSRIGRRPGGVARVTVMSAGVLLSTGRVGPSGPGRDSDSAWQ